MRLVIEIEVDDATGYGGVLYPAREMAADLLIDDEQRPEGVQVMDVRWTGAPIEERAVRFQIQSEMRSGRWFDNGSPWTTAPEAFAHVATWSHPTSRRWRIVREDRTLAGGGGPA